MNGTRQILAIDEKAKMIEGDLTTVDAHVTMVISSSSALTQA